MRFRRFIFCLFMVMVMFASRVNASTIHSSDFRNDDSHQTFDDGNSVATVTINSSDNPDHYYFGSPKWGEINTSEGCNVFPDYLGSGSKFRMLYGRFTYNGSEDTAFLYRESFNYSNIASSKTYNKNGIVSGKYGYILGQSKFDEVKSWVSNNVYRSVSDVPTQSDGNSCFDGSNGLEFMRNTLTYYILQHATVCVKNNQNVTSSTDSTGTAIAGKINELCNAAKSESDAEVPEYVMETDDGGEKASQEIAGKEYVVTEVKSVTIDGTMGTDEINLKVNSNSPSGTIIANSSGSRISSITSGEGFFIMVPVSSLKTDEENRIDFTLSSNGAFAHAAKYTNGSETVMLPAMINATMSASYYYTLSVEKTEVPDDKTYTATINYYYYKDGKTTTDKVFESYYKDGLVNGNYSRKSPDKDGCTIVDKYGKTASDTVKFVINNADFEGNVYYYCSTGGKSAEEPGGNAKTGDSLVHLVWLVGALAISYVIYYFRNLKKEELL